MSVRDRAVSAGILLAEGEFKRRAAARGLERQHQAEVHLGREELAALLAAAWEAGADDALRRPRCVSCGCCTHGCACRNHAAPADGIPVRSCAYHKLIPHPGITDNGDRCTGGCGRPATVVVQAGCPPTMCAPCVAEGLGGGA